MSDSPPVKTGEIQKKRYFLFSNYGCLIITLLFVAGAFALLYPAVQAAREAGRRVACTPDMIRFALDNYHDRFGSFPPAYTTDAEGKPLHSWRTLVVLNSYHPELDIRLDEPWDSEHNSQFHDKLTRFHGLFCESRPEESAKGLSHYRMIIGPDTISNGPNSTKFSDITKDKGEVLLVVETSVGVPWMKPEDLPQSALKNGVVSSVPRRGQPVVLGIGSPHYDGGRAFQQKVTVAHALMVNGSCVYFTAEMPPEELLEKSRIREPE